MDWIDLLIVTCGVTVVGLAAWAFVRGCADEDAAREDARRRDAVVRARLAELGKVKAGKFGGLR